MMDTRGKNATWRRLALGSLVILAIGTGPAYGAGPSSSTPPGDLAAALRCPNDLRGDHGPVLLVPGAGGEPSFIFSAGLEPVLDAQGYAACTLTLPTAGMGDLQIQAEYVVAAVRKMASTSRRPVSVIGVSQGGMLVRWALKWWRDVRLLVDDVIGLAPSNHGGGALLAAICGGPCPPATRQQLPGSRFLGALNQGDETPGGGRVAYSVISSATDVNVPPPSPDLTGERDDGNTAIQAICPGRQVPHDRIQYDAVAIALVLDALGHNGPARGSRISAEECARTYADGVDAGSVDAAVLAGLQHFARNYGAAGLALVEPPLKAYVPGWRGNSARR